MKKLHVVSLCALVALTTAPAWGQYGLYGSPDLVELPHWQSQAGQYGPNYQRGSYAQPAPMNQAPGNTLMYAGTPVPIQTVSETPPQPEPDPAELETPTVVDQLLGQPGSVGDGYGYSGCYCEPACGAPSPGYLGGPCAGHGYGGCQPTALGVMPTWYVYGAGLVMGRNEANRVWTTYESGVEANQLMHTLDTDMPWQGGWEGGIGRFFCCGGWALEASYWGLASVEGFVSSRSIFDGLVSTPLTVGNIQFGTDPADPGTTIYGTDLFDNAEVHILSRRNEVHNVELNLIRNHLDCGCSAVQCNWSLGVRYFRFEEALTLTTLAGGYDWSDDNGAWSAVLADRVQNNLIGCQVGCDMNVNLGCCFSLFVSPTVGIYGNQINHDFRLLRGDGAVAVPDPATGVTDTYPVRNSETALSFLTQVDAGVNWAFDPCWEAFIGYRVVIATGVALADHQIPHYVVDIPEIADIDHNGDLVYHGAFTGVTCKF